MFARDGTKGKYATRLSLAGLGLLGLFVFNRCNVETSKPEANHARDIIAYSLPGLRVFGTGGTETTLEDEGARLERHDCWTIGGKSLSTRTLPEARYNCVFWLTGSDGKAYVTVIRIEYIPKSTVTEVNGRRLDFADVDRYDITYYYHIDQRKLLREFGVGFPE